MVEIIKAVAAVMAAAVAHAFDPRRTAQMVAALVEQAARCWPRNHGRFHGVGGVTPHALEYDAGGNPRARS